MTTTELPNLQQITGSVLIVDDEHANRELLREFLEIQGHQVSEADSGQRALDAVATNPPDVVLLDVMMANVDGYEVCRRLKSDPKTAPIPVILVTGLSRRADRITGIEAGADGFVTKPIDLPDVLLRVRNAIYSKTLYDRVQDKHDRLCQLEALRNDLTHMIVHDMRAPLTVISGYLDLMNRYSKKLNGNGREICDCINEANLSCSNLIEMVSSLLDISRLEEGKMPMSIVSADLADIIRPVIDQFSGLFEVCDLHFAPAAAIAVRCDANLIERVVTNLVSNAVKVTPKDGRVDVEIEREEEMALIRVRDTGPGIPAAYHQRIFEKFGQVQTRAEKRKYSTGLGLTFCKLTVEAHGGNIGVDSRPGEGSTFWFRLPLAAEE